MIVPTPLVPLQTSDGTDLVPVPRIVRAAAQNRYPYFVVRGMTWLGLYWKPVGERQSSNHKCLKLTNKHLIPLMTFYTLKYGPGLGKNKVACKDIFMRSHESIPFTKIYLNTRKVSTYLYIFFRRRKHVWNYKNAISANLPEFSVRQYSLMAA